MYETLICLHLEFDFYIIEPLISFFKKHTANKANSLTKIISFVFSVLVASFFNVPT